MVKETHTKGGYLFALLALPFIDNEYLSSYELIYRFILLIIYMYFSYIGSVIPDIDMRNSYASKTFPKVYKLFGSRFRHRSFTHSLLFLYLLCYLSNIILKYTDNNVVFISSLMPIKTNSKTEKLICKILNFIVIFLIGYRFYILM